MSKAKLHKRLRSVTRYARKLTEKDQLDSKPTNIESHLRRGQNHTDKFGKILDVHGRTLPLFIVKALFLSHNLDHLRSLRRRIQLWERPSLEIAESRLTSCPRQMITSSIFLPSSILYTSWYHFQNVSNEVVYLMPGRLRPPFPRR